MKKLLDSSEEKKIINFLQLQPSKKISLEQIEAEIKEIKENQNDKNVLDETKDGETSFRIFLEERIKKAEAIIRNIREELEITDEEDNC